MSLSRGRRPNFFLVGAPKAGTTSLHDHLSQHPDVFMSPLKETMHFAEEMRAENLEPAFHRQNDKNAVSLRAYLDTQGPLPSRFAGIVTSREDYLRLFEAAGDEHVVGEATPSYLWSKTAAKGIAAFAPDTKVMMILRNPVERLYSQYMQIWNSGDYDGNFETYIATCMEQDSSDRLGLHSPGLRLGLYAEQLQRYRNVFPAEHIGVWLYEESRAAGFHASVFRFLGVDEGFAPDTSRRHLQQRIPRWRFLEPVVTKMAGVLPMGVKEKLRWMVYRKRDSVGIGLRERTMLIEYYRRDVERLEGMLGRDLSAWLR